MLGKSRQKLRRPGKMRKINCLGKYPLSRQCSIYRKSWPRLTFLHLSINYEKKTTPCQAHSCCWIYHPERNESWRLRNCNQIHEVTCTQEWATYNDVQFHEENGLWFYFWSLQRYWQPAQTFGRPRLHYPIWLLQSPTKFNSTMSGRRFMTDLRRTEIKELVAKTLHLPANCSLSGKTLLNTITENFDETSAKPLKAVETDLPVDSSGFASTTYNRCLTTNG